MIAPHKCFLTTYLLIAPFVKQIVNLREIKLKKNLGSCCHRDLLFQNYRFAVKIM
jgi:hypothetical protein